MKKIICLALVLVLAMGILSGCCCSTSERCDMCLDRGEITFPAFNDVRGIMNLCIECYRFYLRNGDLFYRF